MHTLSTIAAIVGFWFIASVGTAVVICSAMAFYDRRRHSRGRRR